MSDLGLYEYVEEGRGERVLFLLHGSGADERDLLPLVEGLNGYTLVGLRGNVVSHGMRRFFPWPVGGEFDQIAIREQADRLRSFVTAWNKEHEVDLDNMAFLGYSNGANMIAALSLLHPEMVRKAVLLHPMLVLNPSDLQDPIASLPSNSALPIGGQAGKQDDSSREFLVTLGRNDRTIPHEEGLKLVRVLEQNGAGVKLVEHEGGHEIRLVEVEEIEDFLC